MPALRRSPRRTIAFEAFGVAAALEFSDRDLEPEITEILPPDWRAVAPQAAVARFRLERVRDGYDASINDVRMVESASLDVALGLLDAEIRMLIATQTAEWIFVHAGVVAIGDGAIVIPGTSFSGKTTLVRSLVEAGAIYYSDEYAVLDSDGMVHPYPRRLSIRGGEDSAAGERNVRELGGVPGEGRAAVALVALTRYRRGACWAPETLTTGEGALAVLANTVPAQKRPGASMRAVGRALRNARILAGDRGEATAAAAALIAELQPAPSA